MDDKKRAEDISSHESDRPIQSSKAFSKHNDKICWNLNLDSEGSENVIDWADEKLTPLDGSTLRLEVMVLCRTSAPLILTFILQYSLVVASVFVVGHIGKVELAAVSLASSKLFL
jgi:hypothetical protein